MQCRSCQHECPAGSQFCIQCGGSLKETPVPAAGLPRLCSGCGLESPPGVPFCRSCGTALAAATDAPPPCAQCNAPIPKGSRFCLKCGTPVPQARIGPAIAPAAVPDGGYVAPAAEVLAVATATPPMAAVTPTNQPMIPSWGRVVVLARDGSDSSTLGLSGEGLTIGRRSEMAFENDRFLADAHIRIERAGSGARLIPLDTVNGVFRRVTSQLPLEHGTIVLIGREVFRFDILDDAEKSPPHTNVHGVTIFGSPTREGWGRLVQLGPSGAVRDVRYLSFPEVILGREEGDIVYRDDAFLSRRHVAFKWDGKRALIADQNSSNGTYVRARGITTIATGDLVRIGEQVLRIELT